MYTLTILDCKLTDYISQIYQLIETKTRREQVTYIYSMEYPALSIYLSKISSVMKVVFLYIYQTSKS